MVVFSEWGRKLVYVSEANAGWLDRRDEVPSSTRVLQVEQRRRRLEERTRFRHEGKNTRERHTVSFSLALQLESLRSFLPFLYVEFSFTGMGFHLPVR